MNLKYKKVLCKKILHNTYGHLKNMKRPVMDLSAKDMPTVKTRTVKYKLRANWRQEIHKIEIKFLGSILLKICFICILLV